MTDQPCTCPHVRTSRPSGVFDPSCPEHGNQPNPERIKPDAQPASGAGAVSDVKPKPAAIVDEAEWTRQCEDLATEVSHGRWRPGPKPAAMTPEQREEQRRSFAHGNVSLSNAAVTREMVDEAAVELDQPEAARWRRVAERCESESQEALTEVEQLKRQLDRLGNGVAERVIGAAGKAIHAEALAERDEARYELALMRPVVEEAVTWRDNPNNHQLGKVVDTYRKQREGQDDER